MRTTQQRSTQKRSTSRHAAAALAIGAGTLVAGGATLVPASPAGAVTTTPVVNTVAYTAPPMTSLVNPMGVATDDNGGVYVSNSEDNVVASISSGGTTSVIGGSYDNTGYSGDGGLGTGATVADPTGLAHDSTGDVFFADTENNVVRKISPAGLISTVAGNGDEGYSGDGGPATRATLDNPQGVAVDSAGDVYIADTYNNVVREVTPSGTIRTVAGTGTAGYGGDGGPATKAQLSSPTDVALDAVGDLYIADAGNSVVRRVGTDGTITTAAGNVAADNAGTGRGGFSGDGGPATAAQLHSPEGIALDRAGDLYIADTFNNAIREVTPSGTISTLVDTAGKKGKTSATTVNSPAASTLLNSPYSVAVDNSTGDVYLADTTNNLIRQVSGLPVPGPAAAGPQGVIGTSGPPPGTPEAVWAASLPAAGLVVGGAALVLLRRRKRLAPTTGPTAG